ncbi:MAG TPA: glycoside hydrolase family 16 protein, partial [Bacteroidales bacterium]|nr:glycoside hydrolase family 16 protein [Bacteroidales bacterium]
AENDLVIDFTVEVADTNRNYVLLTNTSGKLDEFTWHFRKKEIINENQVIAYFPFNGRFDITLTGSLHGRSASVTRPVTIAGDDPHYVNSFKLVWSDNFDGADVNRDWWNFETGATGWGNQELQDYTDGANATIENGILKLTAKKVNDNKQPGSYTSTRITTKSKKEFKYGRIEFRAKLPSGTGIWPALWLLGSNISSVGWPACGEIDVMEYVGYDPNRVHTTIHTPSSYGSSVNTNVLNLPDCEEAFHTYGMIWTERYMKFYIDSVDNIIYTYAPPIKNDQNWPFNQPLFLIMNVAVGGTWGGSMGIDNSIFPQTMEVDYVRVYQPDEV